MSQPFRRLARPLLSAERAAIRPIRCFQHHQVEQARSFSSCPAVNSGHSRWSTIKHDKGKADATKSKQRAQMTKDITNAVKLAGANANMNPRLALAITTAKKSQVPKASIEAAIARGQGLSATGAALESVIIEAILPPSVATIIECQTDNKLRALSDIRLIIKEAGGTVSSVGYMFEKKGRIRFQQKDGVGADEVLEPALEMGVLDVVEDEEGRVVVFTDPTQTKTTAESLAKILELEIEDSETIYDPSENIMVPLDDEPAAKEFSNFLDKLEDVSGVQGVYTNWSKGSISEDVWQDLRSKVSV
ncbi:transcriptional regulator-domain-containing protein [Massariosphaeria phaeospora]|uniref:Transcriptional regulator-domain-containing protein n=1 Tax=Massariosphaeria phaeospora TaxID=100035 RepID=A0A7C8IFS2_9PLEO|nr:transcriptional regulator-domain-containing protein [Massariosphaeria phaeospora]